MKNISSSLALAGALLLTACTTAQAPTRQPATNNMSGMNHDMGTMRHDASMTMDDMVGMLEGRTGDDFDKAFLLGMIPHHQGAVDMAILAKKYAKHPEILKMADDIIAAQQREIDQMKQWQRDWGYVQ